MLLITFPAILPSNKFNSDGVDVISVPLICNFVALTSPPEPYITALLLITFPTVLPSNKFNSVAVDVISVPPFLKFVAFIVPFTTNLSFKFVEVPIPTLPVEPIIVNFSFAAFPA